jgi:hypothetical protein
MYKRCFIVISIIFCAGIARSTDLGLPNIEDIEVASSLSTNKNTKDALNNLHKALCIQLGITDIYRFNRDNLNKKAERSEKDVIKAIDEDTPLRHEDIFFLAGAIYVATVKKEYTQGFSNHLWRSIDHYITIGDRYGVTGIRMNF